MNAIWPIKQKEEIKYEPYRRRLYTRDVKQAILVESISGPPIAKVIYDESEYNTSR